MAHDQRRAARGDRGKGGDDRGLGVGVDPFGGLVEQQQRPVGQHGAGKRDAPLLAGGQAAAVLPDRRVQRDVEGRCGRGGDDRRVGGVGAGQPDVGGDVARHEHRPLGHPRDPAQPGVADCRVMRSRSAGAGRNRSV